MSSRFVIAVLMLGACTRQDMAQVNPTATSSSNGPPSATDLPCDVAEMLQSACWSCHGPTPKNKAPMSLVTRADLLAPSSSDPTQTNAAVAVARMKDAADPMPPVPAAAVPAAGQAALAAWLAGGATAGACTLTDPYGPPSVCTSNKTWTRGDHGSSQMHPGRACISCHDTENEAPGFSIAGTVFPTAHEPDDCNGAQGVSVVITGADGATITLSTNAAGNFYSQKNVRTPYTAKVVSGGKERVMGVAQTDGDCNKCHTETGSDDAPGRIMAP